MAMPSELFKEKVVGVVSYTSGHPKPRKGGQNPGGTTQGAPKGGGREKAPPGREPQTGNPPQEGTRARSPQGGPTRPGGGDQQAAPTQARGGAPGDPDPREEKNPEGGRQQNRNW